jgi:hypothetical protein
MLRTDLRMLLLRAKGWDFHPLEHADCNQQDIHLSVLQLFVCWTSWTCSQHSDWGLHPLSLIRSAHCDRCHLAPALLLCRTRNKLYSQHHMRTKSYNQCLESHQQPVRFYWVQGMCHRERSLLAAQWAVSSVLQLRRRCIEVILDIYFHNPREILKVVQRQPAALLDVCFQACSK